MWNKISVLHPGAFLRLTSLQTLYLAGNYLLEIQGDMWEGLVSLRYLNLDHCNISSVEPSGFSNLSSIRQIYLQENNLSSVPGELFGAYEFPETDGHPQQLHLNLEGNPLQCRSDLCWIKEASDDGWLTSWYQFTTCTNDQDQTVKIEDIECGNA